MLISFIALTLLLLGFNILQRAIKLESWDFSTNPVETQTATGIDCLFEPHTSGIAWTVTSFVELLLFLLVLGKTARMRNDKSPICISRGGSPNTRDITSLMARDSIGYFAMNALYLSIFIMLIIDDRWIRIFFVCLIGAILVFAAEEKASNPRSFIFAYFCSNAYQASAITIMSILAPKMFISLRAECYGSVGIIATELSWNAQAMDYPNLQSTADATG
ncbi:uncharacterized protein FOMMEDRAFT_154407 [Fomitiporia mediterranea MF3/22]|uniref:uncharacterized protein n=1 Tax=Fomitiporia mediterranea (strain MF3/22) TaxID=694068 RepID=UPI0004407C3F|nr:uncharacterized protein FOMMEDRAFT_154407 [Fomitiporia mediterranea MF3/22]EJD05192.1 hypothetical protein FOMMEDRAFT_154407 [Fomitiporia mediterranea MF3/22]